MILTSSCWIKPLSLSKKWVALLCYPVISFYVQECNCFALDISTAMLLYTLQFLEINQNTGMTQSTTMPFKGFFRYVSADNKSTSKIWIPNLNYDCTEG